MTPEPGLHWSPPARRFFARLSWLAVFLLLLVAGLGYGKYRVKKAYERGVDAIRGQDYDHAIAEFSEVIRLEPKYADAYINRGASYAHKGDWVKAIADCNEAIRLNHNFAVAYYNRGIVYRLKGDYDKAIDDYSEAIRLKPDSVNVYIERGHAYDHKRDYDRVIADFNEVIRLDPNQATAYYNRGNAYDHKGDYDRAIADYNEAVRLNLDYAYICKASRAYAYSQKGYYSTAIADYNDAIRLNPTNAVAYINLAWLLAVCPDANHRNGEYAVEYATKACEQSEWKIPAYFSALAVAYAEAGDFDNAIIWENKYLESNPPKDAQEKARQRLSLYEQKKPYHEERPALSAP
jgi:tetratricopeptide (TPR) repeat protein